MFKEPGLGPKISRAGILGTSLTLKGETNAYAKYCAESSDPTYICLFQMCRGCAPISNTYVYLRNETVAARQAGSKEFWHGEGNQQRPDQDADAASKAQVSENWSTEKQATMRLRRKTYIQEKLAANQKEVAIIETRCIGRPFVGIGDQKEINKLKKKIKEDEMKLADIAVEEKIVEENKYLPADLQKPTIGPLRQRAIENNAKKSTVRKLKNESKRLTLRDLNSLKRAGIEIPDTRRKRSKVEDEENTIDLTSD